MEHSTKETGSTIRHVEKVRLNTRQAIRTMANGQTIKQISLESTRQKAALDTKASGETTNSTVMVLRI